MVVINFKKSTFLKFSSEGYKNDRQGGSPPPPPLCTSMERVEPHNGKNCSSEFVSISCGQIWLQVAQWSIKIKHSRRMASLKVLYKTCVINDPLGQTHSPTSSDDYGHLTCVLLCDILKIGNLCENNDHYRVDQQWFGSKQATIWKWSYFYKRQHYMWKLYFIRPNNSSKGVERFMFLWNGRKYAQFDPPPWSWH